MTDDQKLLKEMHHAICRELLARIQSGEATSADLSVARQMLKDNGVTSVPTPGQPLGDLMDSLPFDPKEDEFKIQ